MTDQQARDFAEAIVRGDLLYAHPETIEQLANHSQELASKFMATTAVDPGSLYAIQHPELFQKLPFSPIPEARCRNQVVVNCLRYCT